MTCKCYSWSDTDIVIDANQIVFVGKKRSPFLMGSAAAILPVMLAVWLTFRGEIVKALITGLAGVGAFFVCFKVLRRNKEDELPRIDLRQFSAYICRLKADDIDGVNGAYILFFGSFVDSTKSVTTFDELMTLAQLTVGIEASEAWIKDKSKILCDFGMRCLVVPQMLNANKGSQIQYY